MTLWRIRATIEDRPGYLAVLAASLALRSVNILSVQVHTTEAGAVDDFLVDAPDGLTESDLVAAVERGRGRDCWVGRAEVRGLVDQPTYALGLATRLVRDPESLGEALAALLDGDRVSWRPTPAGDRPGFDGHTMRLPDPTGGRYEVVRSAPTFTPAEYARAQALVELAAAAVRQSAERVTLVLAGGTELTVRPATGDDLQAIAAMHDRCSTTSLQRRYLTRGRPGASKEQLARLLDPTRVLALVVTVDADVVALATLVPEGPLAKVALLVEDRWQRRGIGTAVLRRLLAYAERVGYAALIMHSRADNGAMQPTLRRSGRTGLVEHDGGVVTMTVPVEQRQRIPA